VGQGFSPADKRDVQARAEDPNLRNPARQGR
jgi:hypothetical protein